MKVRVFFITMLAVVMAVATGAAGAAGWEDKLRKLYTAGKKRGEHILKERRETEGGGRMGLDCGFCGGILCLVLSAGAVGCAPPLPPQLDTAARHSLALYRQGRFAAAAPFSDLAVRLAKKDIGVEHPKYAGLLTLAGEVYRELGRRGVPVGLFSTVRDVYESPQHAARGFFQDVDHAEIGPVRLPLMPVQVTGEQITLAAAPRLGADTDAVREAAGCAPAEGAARRRGGARRRRG